MKPKRVLDLYSGAGGAAMGLHRAWPDALIVGVDIRPQKHYPFQFVQADSLNLPFDLRTFDFIWASPPCQLYTKKSATWGRKRVHFTEHPDLIAPTRAMLKASGVPYVIENVAGAPLKAQLMLCGSMFGLRIIKHRYFEAEWSLPLSPMSCNHSDVYNPWQGKGRSAEQFRAAQDTPWIPSSGGASRKAGYTGDLSNAIPPAYSEFIARQFQQ